MHLSSMKTQCGWAVLKQKYQWSWAAADHWNSHILLCSLYGTILACSSDHIPSRIASQFYCKALPILQHESMWHMVRVHHIVCVSVSSYCGFSSKVSQERWTAYYGKRQQITSLVRQH